jgi:hypothetical protein
MSVNMKLRETPVLLHSLAASGRSSLNNISRFRISCIRPDSGMNSLLPNPDLKQEVQRGYYGIIYARVKRHILLLLTTF